MAGWRRIVGMLMVALAIGGALSMALPHDDFNDTPHTSEIAGAISSLGVIVADNQSSAPQEYPANSNNYDVAHCSGYAHFYLAVANASLSDPRQHSRAAAYRNGFIRAFSTSPSTPPPKIEAI